MVGHTHEDIDQMFSCFSRHLSKHDARTLPELVGEMKKAYTPEPFNVTMDCMFDVKEWMDGHIESQVTGHINQHQFKFSLVNGEAVTYYKKWSTSTKWLPGANGLSLVHSLPNGIPKLVQTSTEKIPVRKLEQDIKKLDAKFDEVTENWWESFLSDLEHNKCNEQTWFLQKLKKMDDVHVREVEVTDEEERVGKEIEKLMYSAEWAEYSQKTELHVCIKYSINF